MRLVLFAFVCSLATAFSYSDAFYPYYHKTRFDRSINNDGSSTDLQDIQNEKVRSFTELETGYIGHKDATENICFLEKMQIENPVGGLSKNQPKKVSKTLYASTNFLTKHEAWRLVGGRIVDFCKGRRFILLQENRPSYVENIDPFMNEIEMDENSIIEKRVVDVLLEPLKARAKREIQLEEQQKRNEIFEKTRKRRQAPQRGRFQGQTQSQYMNVDGDGEKEGKAEAEATHQSSHAIVKSQRNL